MEWLKKHRLILSLNIVLIVLAVLCVFGYAKVSGTLHHMDSAKNWAGDSGNFYSYISCYMPVNGKISESEVYSFKNTVDRKLVEASIEAKEGANLWNFAYCGSNMVSVTTKRGSAEVNATGIGGDFFFFHRAYLRDGNYISGNDLMKDKVVLDKELAWKLFGATEVAGMELLINGERFLIAGVIESEDDFASKAAKTNDGGLYMSYEKLDFLTGAKIDCYEAVIPNPVKNFAVNIAREGFGEKNCEIVENSSRYGIENIIKVMLSFGKRSMRVDGIIFPEWENAARLTEDYCAVLLFMAVLCGIVPVIFAVLLAYKKGKVYGGKLLVYTKEKAETLYDKYNNYLYEREKKLKNKEE